MTLKSRGDGRTLLACLCAFDYGLDEVFLLPSCFVVAPPQRSFVFAVEA